MPKIEKKYRSGNNRFITILTDDFGWKTIEIDYFSFLKQVEYILILSLVTLKYYHILVDKNSYCLYHPTLYEMFSVKNISRNIVLLTC